MAIHMKPFIQHNTHQGGGCTNGHLKLEAYARQREERKHQLWLASPEGIAETRRQEAIREVVRLERIKEQELRMEAAKKLDAEIDAWKKKWGALQANPPAGTIVPAEYEAVFRLQQDPRNGNLVVYGLIRIEGSFPQEPRRLLANGGKSGLKVFLNRDSRDYLQRSNVSEFDSCRGDETYVGSVGLKGAKVRIIGHAKSGKSVHGELVHENVQSCATES